MADRYDVIRYPGHAFAQTHPDRVAALAKLFGIDAAAPARCRMLEIGCGDGGNLLGMALALPDAASSASTCRGARSTSPAPARTSSGWRTCASRRSGSRRSRRPPRLRLRRRARVFSWVPDPVRERILELCDHVLSDRGIAFVSYNALPGYRPRQTLRELLAIELEGVDEPRERLAAARAVLARLSGENEPATAIGAEAVALNARTDALLFHDALAEVNDAFAIADFAARAAGHGLQYLAEADPRDLHTDVLPPDVRGALPGTDDVLRRETVLDYLKLRRFRQTLLCRAGVVFDQSPTERGSHRCRSPRLPARSSPTTSAPAS